MKRLIALIIIFLLFSCISCNSNKNEYMSATDFLNICIGENYSIVLEWLGKPDDFSFDASDSSISGHIIYKSNYYRFDNEEKILFIPHLNKNIRLYKDFKEIHFYIKNNRIISWTGVKYE